MKPLPDRRQVAVLRPEAERVRIGLRGTTVLTADGAQGVEQPPVPLGAAAS
ncbi:hypothetical protein SBADM41S_09576 [Streptomyces badius]